MEEGYVIVAVLFLIQESSEWQRTAANLKFRRQRQRWLDNYGDLDDDRRSRELINTGQPGRG